MFVIDCIYKINRYNMLMLDIVDHIVIEIIFYIDFAFVDREKKNRYMWIIDQLKTLYKSLDIRDSIVVVVERDIDLIKALREQYSEVKVLICV